VVIENEGVVGSAGHLIVDVIDAETFRNEFSKSFESSSMVVLCRSNVLISKPG